MAFPMEEAVLKIPVQIDLAQILQSIAQFIGELSGARQILVYPHPEYVTGKKLNPVEWAIDTTDPDEMTDPRLFLGRLNARREEREYHNFQEQYKDFHILYAWGYADNQPVLGFAMTGTREFSKKNITFFNSLFSKSANLFHTAAQIISYYQATSEIINNQSRAIDVLYGVTNAVMKGTEPEALAEEGIEALCRASGADAGICYLYKAKESDSGMDAQAKSEFELKIIASYGLPESTASLYMKNPCPPLFALVAQSHDPVIVPKVSHSVTNWWMLPDSDSGACMALPIRVSNGENLGVLVLLHKEERTIDPSQVTLAIAASSHIGIAARQSVLVIESQKHARSITALYRLSHELSSFLTMDEVFQRAFEIMNEELSIERFWLGLLNETGSRLVGQAAYGTGWKKKLIEINVDISGGGNPLYHVIRSKKPAILDTHDQGIPGIGLRRFMLRNEIDAVGLVPVIAGGQVLGVIAFEAVRGGKKLSVEDLSLLSSFGAEIGNVLLAKRLEERVAAGETMRAAGLLAAGIAHNFNNVLQGILGQASLLELYTDKPEQIQKSARVISEAASKGAALVRQLLSFSHLEEPVPELIDTPSLIIQNKKKFQRLLHGKQYIRYEITDAIVRAYADPRQIVRILQVLLTNASESMEADGCVEILIDEIVVDTETPHYEVPYGKYVRIGVRDNGKGMDLETRKRCFEPFFTTKNVDPSSGLSLKGEGMGLAAAYALARKNGGRLVVDSRPGYGSLFTLYLPVDPEHQIASDPLEMPAESIHSRIEVEKEEPETSLIEGRLSSQGPDVKE
jgi:signal transduction histidine kinase